MMRLALPKGRNLIAARAAFRAAGYPLEELDSEDRKLLVSCPGDGFEILLLKDWDLPLYVEHGVADLGIVGTDVLEEHGSDLLVPLRLTDGGCRLCFIGREGALPRAGEQVTLATKYPRTARRTVATQSWGAEIVPLSGSVELAPLLHLAELALDIVQTGRTLRENHLVELQEVRAVSPCLVVNRAAFQVHRREINELIHRLEAAGVAV